MSSTMQTLIAKVGKGEKGAKDLTYDEAKEAIRLLLEGVATPAQVGSFLVAMRIKSESVSELAAFTAVTREYAPPLPVPPDLGLVDIPTYAGKQDSWHVLLPASIIGMSHPPYFEKIAEALRMLGTPRALVVRGLEGEPELSASSVTKAIELRDDRITPFTLQPKDFGMMFERIEDLASPGVDGEAGLIAKILSNEVKGYQRDWVLMNAAMILYTGSKAASLRAALPLAQETLASGAAKKKLGELLSR